jgi:hypothetical protein
MNASFDLFSLSESVLRGISGLEFWIYVSASFLEGSSIVYQLYTGIYHFSS